MAPVVLFGANRFHHSDAITLIILWTDFIAVIPLIFIGGHFTPVRRHERSPLPLVSPHGQQLFPNCVFRCKAVLDVGLEERQIANPALQQIRMMALVKLGQRFWRNEVELSVAALDDGGLEPALFNPVNDLRFANVNRSRQALHREEITADFVQAEVIPA